MFMMNEPEFETQPAEIQPSVENVEVTSSPPASETTRSVFTPPVSTKPRHGRRLTGLIVMLIVGLIFGALGGGIAGSLVVQNTLQGQAARGVAPDTGVPLIAPVSSTASLAGDTNSAAVTAVKRVGPAVVTVVNTVPQQRIFGFFGDSVQQPKASGSGVIISPQGYIVTNNHVVNGYETLEVIFADGTTVPAKMVGTDSFTDLAVIKVDGSVPAVAELGDSTHLQIGEAVIAIGSPLGDFKN